MSARLKSQRPAARPLSAPPASRPSGTRLRTAKPLPAANDTGKGPADLRALQDGLSALLARHTPDTMSAPAAATWRALAAVMDGADLFRFAPPGTATLNARSAPGGFPAAPAVVGLVVGPTGVDPLQSLLADLDALTDRHSIDGPENSPGRPLGEMITALQEMSLAGRAHLDNPTARRFVACTKGSAIGMQLVPVAPSLPHLLGDLEALAERYSNGPETSGPLREVLVALEAVELLARRSLEAPAGQRLRFKRSSAEAFTLRLGRGAPDSPLEPTHRSLVLSTLEGFEHLSEAQDYLGQIVQLLAPSREGFVVEASELADLDDAAARMTAALSMLSSALVTTAARLTGEAAHRSAVTHVRALEHLRTLSADLGQVEGYRRVALPDARRAFDSDAP